MDFIEISPIPETLNALTSVEFRLLVDFSLFYEIRG